MSSSRRRAVLKMTIWTVSLLWTEKKHQNLQSSGWCPPAAIVLLGLRLRFWRSMTFAFPGVNAVHDLCVGNKSHLDSTTSSSFPVCSRNIKRAPIRLWFFALFWKLTKTSLLLARGEGRRYDPSGDLCQRQCTGKFHHIHDFSSHHQSLTTKTSSWASVPSASCSRT